MRPILSGYTLIALLLVLLVAGCAKQVPLSPEASETETMGVPETSVSKPQESEEEIAARRERALQEALEETERSVVEESMSRRFGQQEQTTPAMMSQQALVNQDVYFVYDSFTLSDEAKAILEQKAIWLTENPRTTVQIEGHCDERGTTGRAPRSCRETVPGRSRYRRLTVVHDQLR
jgi:peptidoglycan-associated lipoprotein